MITINYLYVTKDGKSHESSKTFEIINKAVAFAYAIRRQGGMILSYSSTNPSVTEELSRRIY